MPKLPNSSLTVFDVQVFRDAVTRRKDGAARTDDRWDDLSSQFGTHYYHMPARTFDPDVFVRVLGSSGMYILEMTNSRLKDASRSFATGWKFRVHSPRGTVLWIEQAALFTGKYPETFMEAERLMWASLRPLDIVDMYAELDEEDGFPGPPWPPLM